MRILSIFLLFATISVNAQVTITRKNFPAPEAEYYTDNVIIDPSELPWRLFDTTRAYFEVDVSNIGKAERDTQEFKIPSTVAGGRDVPSAEFALETSFGNTFFKRQNDTLQIVGITPDIGLPALIGLEFKKPLAYLETPLSYADKYFDSTTAFRDLIFAKVDVDMKARYEVNGYGKMKIPNGKWYDALRIKRKFDFDIKITPIIGEPSYEYASLVYWEFYSDSVIHTILRADTRYVTDSLGNEDTVVVFVFSGQPVLVNKSSPNNHNDVRIYSIGHDVIIRTNKPSDVRVYDLTGRILISKQNLLGSFNLNNQSQNNSILIVELKTSDGRLVREKVFLR
ncbi:MAG: hypothetical protein KDC92_03840 [Bacteroidetes bacterium]|nr:hypothetical protein [Bacteroidota bacterium]